MGWFSMVGDWTNAGRDRYRDLEPQRYEEHRRRDAAETSAVAA